MGFDVVVWEGLGKMVLGIVLSPVIGLMIVLLLVFLVSWVFVWVLLVKVDMIFCRVQFISASFYVFGHGGNDV